MPRFFKENKEQVFKSVAAICDARDKCTYLQDPGLNFFHEYTDKVMTQPTTKTLTKVMTDSAAVEKCSWILSIRMPFVWLFFCITILGPGSSTMTSFWKGSGVVTAPPPSRCKPIQMNHFCGSKVMVTPSARQSSSYVMFWFCIQLVCHTWKKRAWEDTMYTFSAAAIWNRQSALWLAFYKRKPRAGESLQGRLPPVAPSTTSTNNKDGNLKTKPRGLG